MSEIPLPITEEDDTEAHCLGVRLADIEAAEREPGLTGHLPRVRDAEVNRAKGDDSQARETGLDAHGEEDVSGHVQPRRDLGR